MTTEDPKADVGAARGDRLRQLEVWLCMAMALALHTSLTASWVILIVGAVVAILRPNRSHRWKLILHAPMTMPLVVFALAVALSTLVNGGLGDSKQIFSNFRSFLIYFYIYQAFIDNEQCRKNTVTVFLFVGALAGLYGTVQQLFNFHPGTYPYLQATGFLQAPMPYAGIMQITSFLALGIYLKKGYTALPAVSGRRFAGEKTPAILFAFIVLANFLGLFFACERSAWLGMLAGILAITLAISPKMFLRGSLACALVLVLGWFCVPAVKTRMSSLTHWQTDVSVSARLVIWKRSIDIIKAHPIFGVGPSHFPSITDLPEALVPGRSTDINHAHSNYFHVLATMGIVGFLAFLGLLIFSLRTALRQGLWPEFAGGVGLGTFGALVSLLVAGIFEYNFGAGQVKLAQWFVLGAIDDGKVPQSGESNTSAVSEAA
jgi:O-antigen ligase